MKKKVGIFMGGYSPEWEISMQSGRTVLNSLSKDEFDCFEVIINRNEWVVLSGEEKIPLNRDNLSFEINGETNRFDLIFNAIHGHPGEDGYLQAIFELNKIPHSSSGHFESALTFNKNKTNDLLKGIGITVPKSLFLTNKSDLDTNKISKEIGFPMFVKPNRSGSSFGVTRVNEVTSLQEAINMAFKEDNQVIIEEAILGIEVGCGVVNLEGKTQAISVTEIVPKKEFFDYEAKYQGASEEITPARIDKKIHEDICRQSEWIYNYLGLNGVIRIDYIIRDNVPYLIEVNSIPGLSPASIIPQQLNYRNWPLPAFFGGLLNQSLQNKQS